MALDRTVFGALDRKVGEGVLAEEGSGVTVGREEVAVTREGGVSGEAGHVGRLHEVVEVSSEVAGDQVCVRIKQE